MKTRRLLSRRTLWAALLGLLLLAWLLPAGLVMLHDPAASHAPLPAEGLLPGGGSDFFLFAHGYVRQWSVSTWEGEDEATADKETCSYHVERGPLDRKAGTFPFGVLCSLDHAEDLEGLSLFVTSRAAGTAAPEEDWSRVAVARVEGPRSPSVTLTCRADVPASSTAYRIRERRQGAAGGGFSQTMLTAPTFLGRVYDRIAWLPAFRWLPALR